MPPPELSSRVEDLSPSTHPRAVFIPTNVASRKIRAALDRLAAGVVWIGGIATIISILGIFVYLLIEVAPLFISPEGKQEASFPLQEPNTEIESLIQQTLEIGVDEYQEVAYVIDRGRVDFYQLPSGATLRVEPASLPESQHVTAVARSNGRGHQFALGTLDGLVVPVEISLKPVFENDRRTIVPTLSVREPFPADPTKGAIRDLAYQETENGFATAIVNQRGELWVTKMEEPDGLSLIDEPVLSQVKVTTLPIQQNVILIFDGLGESLLIGTEEGQLAHWNIQDLDAPQLLDTYTITDRDDSITAMTYLIGDRTLIIGTRSGMVAAWMPIRDHERNNVFRLQQIRSFATHTGAVTKISPSRRDKGFLTADAMGELFLHHSTSGQTLLRLNLGDSPIQALLFSPKANGAVALDGNGKFHSLGIENPHPEITFHTLFQPVLYEGYEDPEYIWQSSSGSDDFEPKFGMWPLIFGTLKGTVYAMILAIPLAVMGAIYTGMFMPSKLRSIVKPVIEIMAALPSVVLGFLAGLWLAPLLEQIFPAVVAMVVMIPATVTLGCIAWQFVPRVLRADGRSGIDLVVILGVLVVTTLGCLAANQSIESWFFNGDYKQWLQAMFGLQYDQRNALVISFAMGFAVIPIIFSISEDSISNVPKHLIAGSLAMGATRWQTMTRLVLISASPGIFSALMIGFGRAVGETMIVLMATGNTPILDWSVFNGFRTLSANIAVEMPEAPHGGTLYRVLFLSGLLLFAFTFFINTIAEVIRQRLRAKYSQY